MKSRFIYNLKILIILFKFAKKYPMLRFRQILTIFSLDSDGFYEESIETYKKVKKIWGE